MYMHACYCHTAAYVVALHRLSCLALLLLLLCVHLDEISNAICSVIDAAELCRNVHPDEYVLHSIAYFML